MSDSILEKLKAPYGRLSRADRCAAADQIERLQDALAPFAQAAGLVHADADDAEIAHHVRIPSSAYRKAAKVLSDL